MILTLRQFVNRERARVCEEYGVSRAEVNRLYPEHMLSPRWWRYVLDEFEAYEDFSPQALTGLSRAQFRELGRTKRGLTAGLPRSYSLACAKTTR